MWIDELKILRTKHNTLEGRLLNGLIAFRGSASRVQDDFLGVGDAVLSVLASRTIGESRELVIVHPEASPEKSYQALLALAFAELQRCEGQSFSSGPAGILFVTQHVTDTRNRVANVRVGTVGLTDVFRVTSLSATPARDWRNILIANPGWALRGSPTLRGLRALVVDASHPRTLRHLPALLENPELAAIPLRIVVCPPHDPLIAKSPSRLVWLWDPNAVNQLQQLLAPDRVPARWGRRSYWLANHSLLDTHFGDIEKLLNEATRLGTVNQRPPELLEAWGVLMTMRSLCVPLEQAERAWRNTRFVTRLQDRLAWLGSISPVAGGELRHFLSMHWPSIVAGFEAAYTILANEGLPPKFFALIDALDEYAQRGDTPLRIVTLGQAEVLLLSDHLAEIDEDLRIRLETGTLEVLHQREEARQVAEGRVRSTILMGSRSSQHRYLDLFTSHETHVVAYPIEAVRDQQRIQRLYEHWEPIGNGYRDQVADQLGIKYTSPSGSCWQQPEIRTHVGKARIPSRSTAELPEISIDTSWTTPNKSPEILQGGISIPSAGSSDSYVQLYDIDGGVLRVASKATIDIYRPETERLVRVPVTEVLRGDLVVLILDEQCESLFERLCETSRRRRPLVDTVRLDRWNLAKQRLSHEYDGNRQAIYNALAGRINVGYPALKEWFGPNNDINVDCIGPLQETDFREVALLSRVYREEADIHATFLSIHAERVNRRKLGRQLRGAIKNLAQRRDFEQVLRTAEALNSEVEEVMHALELREISRIYSDSSVT